MEDKYKNLKNVLLECGPKIFGAVIFLHISYKGIINKIVHTIGGGVWLQGLDAFIVGLSFFFMGCFFLVEVFQYIFCKNKENMKLKKSIKVIEVILASIVIILLFKPD